MLDFGKPINDVPDNRKKYPPLCRAGYKCKIVYAKIEKSKAGNDTLRIDVDIADGKYKNAFSKHPKRMYQCVTTDVGKAIIKRIIQTVLGEPENEGLIAKEVLLQDKFDESCLVGLTIGAIFIPDGKYLKLDTLCTTKYALALEPGPVQTPEVKKDDLPF